MGCTLFVLSVVLYVSYQIFISCQEQSRRDDLESLGYMLMYFLRGSLPWQGMKGNTKKAKYDNILEKKMSTSTAVLCKNFPAEFRSYFDHVKSLRFDDRPDYDYLKRMFRELFFRKGFMYDHIMDWDIIASGGIVDSQAGTMSGGVKVATGGLPALGSSSRDGGMAALRVDDGCPPVVGASQKLRSRGVATAAGEAPEEDMARIRIEDNVAFSNRNQKILEQVDGLANQGQIAAFNSATEVGVAVAGTNLRVHTRSNDARVAVQEANRAKSIKESSNNVFDMAQPMPKR